MQITLQFDTDNKKDTYWEDIKKLEQLIKIDDYKRLIFEFNEYLIFERKNSGYDLKKLSIIENVQEQWIEFMKDRNINIDDIV